MTSHLVWAVVVAVGFWAGTKSCRPEPEQVVPTIVTVYDTVDRRPDWLEDSIKVWKKRVYTTDTLPLVITETVIDTQLIPVDAPREERPDVWPILSVHGPRSWADTTITRTFSLRDGREAVSEIFSTGYITDIELTDKPTPRITFRPFPPKEKHGFFHNPKVFGIGLGTGVVLCLAFC